MIDKSIENVGDSSNRNKNQINLEQRNALSSNSVVNSPKENERIDMSIDSNASELAEFRKKINRMTLEQFNKETNIIEMLRVRFPTNSMEQIEEKIRKLYNDRKMKYGIVIG